MDLGFAASRPGSFPVHAHRGPHRLTTVLFAVLSVGAVAPVVAQDVELTSHYIPMRDGTRIAADVYLPQNHRPGQRLPALLELTRYWRAGVDPTTGIPRPSLNALDRYFLDHGYALVTVDVRGSGASFGTRPVEYGPQEVRDGFDIVEWVVGQDWSSGTVGAYGTSYSGTTAELLAAAEHPAVKAVIPGWSDFDVYASPVRPYGLVADFIEDWGFMVGAMDRNDSEVLGAVVRKVDVDVEGVLRGNAVAEHGPNPDVYRSVMDAEFRDDVLADGITYAQTGPVPWRSAIERSDVPMLVLVSWLDAGTIEGTFQRFNHFANPQKVVIMATSHGGAFHASPFVVGGDRVPPVPTMQEQFEMRRTFFDRFLKDVENDVEQWPAIRYYNLGEEAFRETDVWPPRGVAELSFYLQSGKRLGTGRPTATGRDEYAIDFGVSTGSNNRWRTQLGEPVLNLDDRAAMDDQMLTYTTAPLEQGLQITGTPVVTLHVSSTHEDVAVLAYLEVVDPDGRSRYVTEGGLRLIHRKVTTDPDFSEPAYHSFSKGDAAPMVPGQVAEVSFRLWPTSVQVQPGQSLRLAIAGADAGTFVRIPDDGNPTINVHWNRDGASVLTIPGSFEPAR